MKKITPILGVLLTGAVVSTAAAQYSASEKKASDVRVKSVYDITVKNIDGKDVALSKYEGDVMLIINMASK